MRILIYKTWPHTHAFMELQCLRAVQYNRWLPLQGLPNVKIRAILPQSFRHTLYMIIYHKEITIKSLTKCQVQITLSCSFILPAHIYCFGHLLNQSKTLIFLPHTISCSCRFCLSSLFCFFFIIKTEFVMHRENQERNLI